MNKHQVLKQKVKDLFAYMTDNGIYMVCPEYRVEDTYFQIRCCGDTAILSADELIDIGKE